MTGSVNDYIAYRLEKARQTHSDAKILAENKSWNSSVNNLHIFPILLPHNKSNSL